MTQDPDNDDEREAPKRPRVSRWAIFRSVSSAVLTLTFFGVCGGGLLAVFHPDTPLPPQWRCCTDRPSPDTDAVCSLQDVVNAAQVQRRSS